MIFVSSIGYPYYVELVQKRLCYHGNLYGKHYVKNDIKYWRCYLWKKGCRARLSTRSIGGYEMTSKRNIDIIHNNHDD